jgi:hypothetical protein
LADKLRPTGSEKEKFGFGRHCAALCRMLQEVSDALADGCAAGFADHNRRVACGRKRFGKQSDLCALAASFRTLEADEETYLTVLAHHGDHES